MNKKLSEKEIDQLKKIKPRKKPIKKGRDFTTGIDGESPTKNPLKEIPENNKGLSKLPEDARNKMGFKKYGGKITYRMGGGKVVSVGYDD